MLKVDMEYRGKILFVNIIGSLDKRSINKIKSKINYITKEYGIGHIRLDLTHINYIDVLEFQKMIDDCSLTYDNNVEIIGI
jgi:anti-anti-sigma factor